MGTENSLITKLESALHLISIGNANGAIQKLTDFIMLVEALEDKKLTLEQSTHLIAEVQRIINIIQG